MIGSLRRSIRCVVTRLEVVTDRQLFACSVLWVVTTGLALQLIVLPYITPFAHAGHGLIANLDIPGFHAMAVEMAQRTRMEGFRDWGHWRTFDYNYPVAINSLFYLIYPEPWITLPFNGVLFGIVVVAVRRVVTVLSDSRGVALAGLFPFFIFPSFIVIWGQPHRDLITGTGFSLVLCALVLAAYRSGKAARLPVLAILAGTGMAVMWVSRPYALSLVAAGTLAFMTLALVTKHCHRGRLLTVTAVVLLAAFVNIKGWTEERLARVDPDPGSFAPAVAGPVPAESVRNPPAAPDSETASGDDDAPSGWSSIRWPRSRRVVSAIARSRNCFPPPSTGMADTFLYNLCHVREGFIVQALAAGASSGYDYDIRLRSAEDFVAYAPRAVAFALFAPGPQRWGTERTTLGRLATLFVPFEMIVAYTAFLLALVFGRSRLARLNVWAVAAFCITYITIYAFATPQIGGLYRMRAFAFAILISTALAVALPRPMAPGERDGKSLH